MPYLVWVLSLRVRVPWGPPLGGSGESLEDEELRMSRGGLLEDGRVPLARRAQVRFARQGNSTAWLGNHRQTISF